jgi:FkbM family methyltransferase
MDFEGLLEKFYKKCSKQILDSLVIDVGAHVGRHSIPLSKLAGNAGMVFCFEPIPEIRLTLASNLKESNVTNAVLFPFAISNKCKIAKFNFIPNLPEESGLKKRHIYNAKPTKFIKLTVPVYTLDKLISEHLHVSFIKIDVEGAELDVLEGSLNLIKRCRPVVAFEAGASSFLGYHDHPEKIFDFFNEIAYSVFSIYGDEIKSSKAFELSSYKQDFWDYIAIPDEDKKLSKYL